MNNVGNKFTSETDTILKNFEIRLIFRKKDGTLRKMLCTQDFNKIPVDRQPKGGYHHNPEQVRVWDLEKNDWRSFLKSSIIGWTF